MREVKHPHKTDNRFTIKSLHLDIESALEGKTWLLLPEGYRDRSNGPNYPLPSRRQDLQKIAAITVPPWDCKQDVGCIYVRRAMKEWKKRAAKKQSLLLDMGRKASHLEMAQDEHKRKVKALSQQARDAVDEVRKEAAHAIASLNDLFALGRKGLDEQMRAHLKNEEHHGEKIDARAFRECFRIVTQAVKGLGLPSDQREKAADTVLEEVASALRSTQEITAMATTEDDGAEH